jgi:sulfotransferase family protein
MTLRLPAVSWKGSLNRALRRVTGLQIRRVPRRAAPPPRVHVRAGDRMVEAPAFVLSSVRSGSTLLRVLLDSHSKIHAPQELHLRHISVGVDSKYAERALDSLGLDGTHLEYLLWDRLLHRELSHSGKTVLVNKTPSDVFIVDRIQACWDDARFIFLLRHPAAIAASRQATRPQDSPERNAEMVRRYCAAVERARQTLPGHTVRYEDLASDPAGETQKLCAFLGVPWEPTMLDYGEFRHGRFKPGLGDWTDKIKSGQVQPPTLPPAELELPEELRELAVAWGYEPSSRSPSAAPDAQAPAS